MSAANEPPPIDGKQSQLDGEEQDPEKPEPIDGHRLPDQADPGRDRVDPGIAVDRSEDAERQRDDEADEERCAGKQERRRQSFEDEAPAPAAGIGRSRRDRRGATLPRN